MADRNLVLQLLITAKDEASTVFGKIFSALNDTTNVIAGKIRDAFTGIFGGALDGAIDFEAQMDRVIAKGDSTYQSMAGLNEQVRQVGAQFGISGTEAAQGMEALAAAGLTAADAIGALPSVLALASSEQIGADAAAQKLIDSLSVMGLGFDQAGRMADVLAKGANITTSSAGQLADALSEAGGTAKAAGMDLESTVAALDLLHKNGIKGSEAGTALKGILVQLLDPASKASQALTALGIDSRDLGGVLDGLKAKGGGATQAILAFGTEVGPGLRALLSEGQAGLLDYTTQLRDAGGAAQDASAQMSGNLKGAMASLASIWETVKQSLLEPALEPLAKAAREAATALQESLGSQALKSVQDSIGAFVKNGVLAVKEFIQGFDFSAVVPAIEAFAGKAKTTFEDMATAAAVAGNGITLVWNGVTLAVKSVASVLAGFTAAIATSVESVIVAMNKVGLVSDDAARQVSAAAEVSRNGVSALRDGIEEDAGDIKKAWDGLTSKIGETPAVLDKIQPKAQEVNAALQKIQLPDLGAKQLQPLIQDLDYYRTKVKQAADDQRSASVAAQEADRVLADMRVRLQEGTISQESYNLALTRADAAHQSESAAVSETVLARARMDVEIQNNIRGINTESTATTQSIATKDQQISSLQRTGDSAKKYSDAVAATAEASLGAIQADITLAKTKGDTAEAQRLSATLSEVEHDWAIKIANAKLAESQAELALAQAKRNKLAAQVANNEASQEDLRVADLEIAKDQAAVQAATANVAIQKELRTSIAETTTSIGKSTSGFVEQTRAVEENAAAMAEGEKKTAAFALLQKQLTEYLKGARERMDELSASARLYFEAMLEGTLSANAIQGAAQGSLAATQAWTNATREASDELAKFGVEVVNASRQMGAARQDLLFAADDMRVWISAISLSEAATKKAFYEQSSAAESLRLRIHEMVESGRLDMAALNSAEQEAQTGFKLLDDQDLANLRGEIEAAKQKLEEMQHATEDARTRLAELNAELLEAQGQDQKAELLRQQLDYQTRLAEIEKQRREAELLGNRELMTILDQQAAVLRQINDAKIASIQADQGAQQSGDRVAQSWQTAAVAIKSARSELAETHSVARQLSGVEMTGFVNGLSQAAEAAGRLREVL